MKYILLFSFLLLGFVSFSQNPKVNQIYTTSSLGYSACKTEADLQTIVKAAVQQDNYTFQKMHNNKSCIVLAGNVRVKVIKILEDGDVVYVKDLLSKQTFWTIKEAIN